MLNDEHRAVFESHKEVFDSFKDKALSYAAKGRFEAATAFAQMAGDWAWHNPFGLYTSPSLERCLTNIGLQLKDEKAAWAEKAETKTVLHVLTQAYPTGGHTRAMVRWVQKDTERQHSLALTRQSSLEVPDFVNAEFEGDRIHKLDRKSDNLLKRAIQLRQLSYHFDRIVLHVHPYDVVPSLAFAPGVPVPPVIFLNHADHVFSFGLACSRAMANMRPEGKMICETRRAFPKRHTIVPHPLPPLIRQRSREEAKKHIGFDDQTVILTVASGYKFSPLKDYDYIDVMSEFLSRESQCRVIVVGASPDERWQRASEQTDGRLQAVGRKSDPNPYFEAADIYLDSMPFASVTSLLEAVCYGNPALSYCPQSINGGPCNYGDFALTQEHVHCHDVEQLYSKLSEYCRSQERRREVGAQFQDIVEYTHRKEGWNKAIDEAFAFAGQQPEPQLSERFENPVNEDQISGLEDYDALLLEIHRLTGQTLEYHRCVKNHMRLLPTGARMKTWAGLRLRHGRVRMSYLKPEQPESKRESKKSRRHH